MPSSSLGSVSSLVNHFTRSAGSFVNQGMEALAKKDLNAFSNITKKVESLEIIKLISAKITSSSQSAETFAKQVSLETGLQFLSGAVLACTGAYALSEAVGIAAGIGFVSWAGTAIVAILAVVLLLYGIGIVQKSLLKRVDQERGLSSLVEL